jgi:hypothetical protein
MPQSRGAMRSPSQTTSWGTLCLPGFETQRPPVRAPLVNNPAYPRPSELATPSEAASIPGAYLPRSQGAMLSPGNATSFGNASLSGYEWQRPHSDGSTVTYLTQYREGPQSQAGQTQSRSGVDTPDMQIAVDAHSNMATSINARLHATQHFTSRNARGGSQI